MMLWFTQQPLWVQFSIGLSLSYVVVAIVCSIFAMALIRASADGGEE